MEEKTIELPEEIFDNEKGTFEGENYKLTLRNETGYFWIKLGRIPVNQDFAWNFTVPGSLPVSCCAAEMDARNIPLIENDAVIEIKSVQRTQGSVRVVLRRNAATNSNLSVAVGVIYVIEI